jgi:hypothetical protein
LSIQHHSYASVLAYYRRSLVKVAHGSISIHVTFGFRSIEQAKHRRNKGNAIASYSILPEHAVEVRGVVSHEKYKIDVYCHGQRPIRVRLHKPMLILAKVKR